MARAGAWGCRHVRCKRWLRFEAPSTDVLLVAGTVCVALMRPSWHVDGADVGGREETGERAAGSDPDDGSRCEGTPDNAEQAKGAHLAAGCLGRTEEVDDGGGRRRGTTEEPDSEGA